MKEVLQIKGINILITFKTRESYWSPTLSYLRRAFINFSALHYF
jgi:hypothetical protein